MGAVIFGIKPRLRFLTIAIGLSAFLITAHVQASESQSFQQAQKSNTIESYQSFLNQFPQGQHAQRAIYARDKLIFRKAQRDSSPKSVAEFIQNYPDSPWRADAERALAIRDGSFGPKDDAPTPKKSRYQTTETSGESSNDRVLKALNTYSERRQQKAKVKHEQQEQEKKLAAKKRQCQKMKDQLDIYKEGRRWYDLNKDGERIFLDDQQTEQLGQYYRNSYQEACNPQ